MTRIQRAWIIGGALALAAGIAIGFFVIRPLPRERLIEERPMTTPPTPESTHVAAPTPGTNPAASDTSRSTLILLDTPKPHEIAKSPLWVVGRARGTWFFEAEFPVRLLDANGAQITWGSGRADGEWMTPDFVPFSVVLNFAAPATDTGTLVLERSNPSGLAEHAGEVRVPVRFR